MGGRFCPAGRPPSYDDPGLREHLTRRTVPCGGLLLCGPVGSHKSHLLAARAADALARGYTARVVSWIDVVGRCHYSYSGRAAQHETELLAELAAVAYLGLDDVGVGLERRGTGDGDQ